MKLQVYVVILIALVFYWTQSTDVTLMGEHVAFAIIWTVFFVAFYAAVNWAFDKITRPRDKRSNRVW